jgi:1-acyl-sn-glycerol-3-phosphate acyltransferase
MHRLVLRSLAIILGILACVPLHYGWRLFGRRSLWPRRFLWWVGYAAGVRTRISGTPRPAHVLFAGNHLSWLDIMVLAGASGTAFVSKAEVGRTPVIGWLANLNNTVYVERGDRGAAANQAAALRAALATGQPVALFPEGGTDGGAETLPFRASLFAALIPPLPGVMLQSVALDYGPAAAEIAWTGDEPALANVKRVLSRRGTLPVTLHFAPPIDPAGVQDRKAMANAARSQVVAALEASAPASSASRADRL